MQANCRGLGNAGETWLADTRDEYKKYAATCVGRDCGGLYYVTWYAVLGLGFFLGLMGAAGHAHHAAKPFVYKQGPMDGIFAKAIPLGFVAMGAGIVGYGATQLLFGESGQ
ncbi:hypothetical protein Rsub_00397 [Raphidocelis subcapitata]|uniref:Uncharacterized protein n=1 Tax=Raphidocelis subcapitata TaxID=307507 RepID=A0A2V0NK77_9CHLO|nr:hypothetical protein Rsub_00397 [Raphidocelis subcapitata]|eukprot:GBF87686.1 hypothetical protein Rsub_00397 [Raphidocelis subcapitata]